MKIIFLVSFILAIVTIAIGQSYESSVEIATVYSQNEKFYLKSIPYDNESPSLRGKTSVYETGNATPLYVLERGFDYVNYGSNNLILSNTGEIIFHVIPYDANEEKEGLKSITIYKKGNILKSYTEPEITGCNQEKERCGLVYSNYREVVDEAKSNWGTPNFKKAFKDGVNEQEKFLSNFPIFSFEDTVYLTDSKKKTHLFDLKKGVYIKSDSFDNMFEQIKHKGRFNKTNLEKVKAPVFLDFPKLKNGKDTYQSLAAHLGMKTASIVGTQDDPYKLYRFKFNSFIHQDGSLEILDFEFFDELPKEKIIEFFKSNKFDSSSVPKAFEKWHLRDEYFYFRNKNDKIARQEKQQEEIKYSQELQKQRKLEIIDGDYIPKNLEECFIELDKLLSEVDKKEMQALPKRDDMIKYHLGLGMGLRNRWRLWSASRLQTYFLDRKITHPDSMSSIILFYYHDWLNGKKETWKEWEKNPQEIYK